MRTVAEQWCGDSEEEPLATRGVRNRYRKRDPLYSANTNELWRAKCPMHTGARCGTHFSVSLAGCVLVQKPATL